MGKSNLKASIVSTKYSTDNKSYVKCELSSILKYDNTCFGEKVIVYGVSRLSLNDKFNYEKGCKIALAKAERNLYKLFYKVVKSFVKEMTPKFEAMCDFVGKSKDIIRHNSEYIHNIANAED